tara:strand:- start:8687 stop:9175 length:489 start_codon:yes stop_codon:yes gene_type:complete
MFTKLVRIGRDAEIKYLASGTEVMSFPAVYDIGFGDKKRGQWIECVMFGGRCTKVVEYMVKGKQIVIYADDVGIDEWDKPDGSGKGFKLKCKLVSFDFVSGGELAQQPQAQRPQAQQQPQQQQAHPQGQPMGVSQQAQNVSGSTCNICYGKDLDCPQCGIPF